MVKEAGTAPLYCEGQVVIAVLGGNRVAVGVGNGVAAGVGGGVAARTGAAVGNGVGVGAGNGIGVGTGMVILNGKPPSAPVSPTTQARPIV